MEQWLKGKILVKDETIGMQLKSKWAFPNMCYFCFFLAIWAHKLLAWYSVRTYEKNLWQEPSKEQSWFRGLVYRQQQKRMARPAGLDRLLDGGEGTLHGIKTHNVVFLAWSGPHKVNIETQLIQIIHLKTVTQAWRPSEVGMVARSCSDGWWQRKKLPTITIEPRFTWKMSFVTG